MGQTIMEKESINTWFHHLSGENLLEKNDKKFIEYRRKWEEWPSTFKIENFPLFIDIEVTNRCNLKCPFCSTTISGRKDKKGFISKKNVEKIIDEGSDNGLYGVKFNIRGEPLLHRDIDYFIKYAKKKGLIDVYFNTNALLLTEEKSNKLIEAGLDRISISFEGYTKDIYEKNRVGSDYKKVLNNIENLQFLKNKLNVKHPKVRIQTIRMDKVFSIYKYKKFWKDKVDEVAFLDYKDMNVKRKGRISSWVCPQLWQRMAVLWNGDIFSCNHDNECLICIGNINDISIRESWDSGKLKYLRKMHKRGLSHKIKSCDGCFLRNNLI